MGRHDLDLPVLERERLVFFVVQIELPHSEKQLVGVDAAREFYIFIVVSSPPTHLSTQWAAVIAQFSLRSAAPHLCKKVAGENRVIS